MPSSMKSSDPLSALDKGITCGSGASSEHKANEEPKRKISCRINGTETEQEAESK